MSYNFNFGVNYQFSLDSVNPIAYPPRVYPPYTFTFFLDYRLEGGIVVGGGYPYITRHVCQSYLNATGIFAKFLAPFEDSIAQFNHNCAVFGDGNHIHNKLLSDTGQADLYTFHACSDIEDAARIQARLHSTHGQADLYTKHYCAPVDDAITKVGCLAFTNKDGIFIVNEYCIPIRDVKFEHNTPRDAYYFQPNNELLQPYVVTTTPFTQSAMPPPVLNQYEFTASSGAYSFTIQSTPSTGLTPSPAYIYPFSGIGQYLGAYRDYVRGALRAHTCYNVQQATRDLVHFCEVYENAKYPDRGRSIIVIPPIEPPVPIIPKQITIPTKNYYDNTVTFTVKRGVDVLSDTITFDSFSASASVNVNPWQFELTTPDISAKTLINKGDVLEVDLGHSGYVFKMYVESKTTTLRFNSTQITISGRGLTAEMSFPFVAPNNVTYGTALNLTQIMELQLPLGWTITNNNFDWLVPPFTYNVENSSPAATIQDICEKTGGVMIAHPSLKQIDIRPRYPIRPWLMVDANVDYFIPLDAIDELSLSDDIVLIGDSIYIHGTTSDGVLGNVVKAGEAGTAPLPTIANELMVDADAVRSLGNRVLSASRDLTTIKSMVINGINDIPLIQPTYICKVDGQYLTTSSISIQVSNTLGIPTIRQAITFGESVSDALTAINELIPSSPVLIGTVVNIDGDALIIRTPEGGSFRAFGAGDVNGKYYFKAGQIIGNAPTLPDLTISI